MNILALDTASDACSAALVSQQRWIARRQAIPRGHAAALLPMIDELLSEAGLQPDALAAIAFGRGPGSFTGVRIATGVAQGLALGAGLPLIPVSNLAMIAQAALRLHGWERIQVATDARMDEVYTGAFVAAADGLVQGAGPEKLVPVTALALPDDGPWYGAGSGWSLAGVAPLAAALAGVAPDILPDAEDALRLAIPDWRAGRTVAPEDARPVYLRDEVARRQRP